MKRPRSPLPPSDIGLFRLRMIWLLASGIMLSGVVLALMIVSHRAQALRSGEQLTESFAHLIAEPTNSTLQTVDLRLQLAALRLKALEESGELTGATARDVLSAEIKDMPAVRALSVASAEGLIVYSTAVGGFSVATRPYFQTHQKEVSVGFHVGPPVRGLESGAWIITASRPLSTANGAFAGMIVAAVDPGYFESVWARADMGPDDSIALFRRDGVVLMRSPFMDDLMGAVLPRLAIFGPRRDTAESGTYLHRSRVDGVSRVFAFRALPSWPDLVVVVGKAYASVLAPWRQFATIAGLVWALASALVGVLGFFLDRAGLEKLRIVASEKETAERLTLATEASSIGVWDWDLKADSWYATPTYFAMLGYGTGEGVGQRAEWLDHVHPDDRGMVAANIAAALQGGEVPYRHDARLRHRDGAYRWMSVIGRVLARDETGKPRRLLGVMMDITDHRHAQEALGSSLREKEGLLKEVHHRVKNNLQVIASLLRLEAGRSAEGATKLVLKEMQGRIHSMALLHEMLYRTGNFARVDLAEYLRRLATQLVNAQNATPRAVALVLDVVPIEVDIDQAIPAALMVNELLSNALKHGFPEGASGQIHLSLALEAGMARLLVSDNGVGLPVGFESRRGQSLGLQLVGDLARQLGGTLAVGPVPSATFTVTFTVRPHGPTAP